MITDNKLDKKVEAIFAERPDLERAIDSLVEGILLVEQVRGLCDRTCDDQAAEARTDRRRRRGTLQSIGPPEMAHEEPDDDAT